MFRWPWSKAKSSHLAPLNAYWRAILIDRKLRGKARKLEPGLWPDSDFWNMPPADLLSLMKFLQSGASPLEGAQQPGAFQVCISRFPDSASVEDTLAPAILLADRCLALLPYDINVLSLAHVPTSFYLRPMHFHVMDRARHLEQYLDLAWSLEPLIRRGVLSPLPSKMSLSLMAESVYDPPEKRLGEMDKGSRSFGESVESEFVHLNSQAFLDVDAGAELATYIDQESLVFRMAMPFVAGIPVADLAKLRDDENDRFLAFRRALEKHLFGALARGDSAEAITIALQEIDDEVARLRDAFQQLKAIRRVAGASLTSLAISVVVTLTGDHGAFGTLATMLGGGSLYALLDRQKDAVRVEAEIGRSKYYVPLRLLSAKRKRLAAAADPKVLR